MSINIPTAHKARIRVPYGELSEVVDWCQRNCSGDWRFTEGTETLYQGDYVFLFESERDYVAFLMWKK